MCGIAGIITPPKKIQSDAMHAIGESFCALLRHRGPDASQHRIVNLDSGHTVCFAHTLLSVMGEIEASIQPFENEEGILVFNGSIYNFQELGAALKRDGYTVDCSSDTSVLFTGFQNIGISFLDNIRGMFAFAYFSKKTQELFLVRDPIGVKPLYFAWNEGTFLFASEYKAILPYIHRSEIDPEAMYSYLQRRYVPGEQTLFKNIRKVPPGSYVHFNLHNAKIETKKYFDVSQVQSSDDIYTQLKIAIERRSVASREVAALLSGGIDSSIVCDILEQCIPSLTTYTLQIQDYDESAAAKEIAKALGVKNTVVPQKNFFIDDLSRLTYHLDDPYGDPIILALDTLFSTISKQHRIVVTGEGADELFSGYIHHRAINLFENLPQFLRKSARAASSILPLWLIRMLLPYSGRVEAYDLEIAYSRAVQFINDPSLNNFYNIFSTFSTNDILLGAPAGKLSQPASLKTVRDYDIANWLPESQCFKLDKISMQYGVEAREPFLDVDLFATIFRIAPKMQMSYFKDKLLLRGAIAGKTRIPSPVVHSRKNSFFMPLQTQKNAALMKSCEEVVHGSSALLEQYVYKERIASLFDKTYPSLLNQKRLFSLASLALWHEKNKTYIGKEFLLNG